MKKYIQTKTCWLTAAAVVLVLCLSAREAMAYFTTYVKAEGGYEITLGNETEVQENVKDMTKEITISNTGATDCYVRVKVFCGSQLEIEYAGAVDDQGNAYWTKGDDGYWYYRDILPVHGQSEVLQAKIRLPEEYTDSFNVIVVQECTSVRYKEDGTPYADWEAKADTKTDIGVADPGKEKEAARS